jgi:hypothetical protein
MELAARYGWAIGFMDEIWWSRFARPGMHLWSKDRPVRLVEQTPRKDDPGAQALACYGVWWANAGQLCLELARQQQRVRVLIWDNASWHVSAEVRQWIATHNATAKRTGQGVRILVAGLPTKSPWLSRIEARWQHGKQAIVAAKRVLSAGEVEARVCAYFGAAQHPRLMQQVPATKPAPLARTRGGSGTPLPQQTAQSAQTQQVA